MPDPSEALFEGSICGWLAQHGGYVAFKNELAQGDQRDFNAALGLDTSELFTFLGAIQIDA